MCSYIYKYMCLCSTHEWMRYGVCVGLHSYRSCLSIITRSLTPLMAKCFFVNNIVLCAYVCRNMFHMSMCLYMCTYAYMRGECLHCMCLCTKWIQGICTWYICKACVHIYKSAYRFPCWCTVQHVFVRIVYACMCVPTDVCT